MDFITIINFWVKNDIKNLNIVGEQMDRSFNEVEPKLNMFLYVTFSKFRNQFILIFQTNLVIHILKYVNLIILIKFY